MTSAIDLMYLSQNSDDLRISCNSDSKSRGNSQITILCELIPQTPGFKQGSKFWPPGPSFAAELGTYRNSPHVTTNEAVEIHVQFIAVQRLQVSCKHSTHISSFFKFLGGMFIHPRAHSHSIPHVYIFPLYYLPFMHETRTYMMMTPGQNAFEAFKYR